MLHRVPHLGPSRSSSGALYSSSSGHPTVQHQCFPPLMAQVAATVHGKHLSGARCFAPGEAGLGGSPVTLRFSSPLAPGREPCVSLFLSAGGWCPWGSATRGVTLLRRMRAASPGSTWRFRKDVGRRAEPEGISSIQAPFDAGDSVSVRVGRVGARAFVCASLGGCGRLGAGLCVCVSVCIDLGGR